MARLLVLLLCAAAAAATESPRLLILTDIGGDPDDQQSMRRLMLYANEFEIAGLIATSRGVAGQFEEPDVQPALIHEILDDYEAVYPNLRRHAGGYPSADSLRRIVASGSPQRGVAHLGPGRSTTGSQHIIASVDASTRPLHIAIWGGAHDLAQALHDVREQRIPAALDAFLAKLRVYAISDQDGRGDSAGTGAWIRENFPNLRYVESAPPGSDRFAAVFRGMYQNDARGQRGPTLPLVSDRVAALNSEPWLQENVLRNHGPLGAGYPVVGQNPKTPRNTRGVKEGDTPSWFFVLSTGLNDPQHPNYGGWGGRFKHDTAGHWIDAQDNHPSGESDPGLRQKWTVARWREHYQNDFAARLDWSATEKYGAANHPPIPALDDDKSTNILYRQVQPGETLTLDATATTDPDSDPLTYKTYFYREPGTYSGELTITADTTAQPKVEVPRDAAGQHIHVILQVTDGGQPNLTRYRRLILKVAPTAPQTSAARK